MIVSWQVVSLLTIVSAIEPVPPTCGQEFAIRPLIESVPVSPGAILLENMDETFVLLMPPVSPSKLSILIPTPVSEPVPVFISVYTDGVTAGVPSIEIELGPVIEHKNVSCDVRACAGSITESTTGRTHDSGRLLLATTIPLPVVIVLSSLRRDKSIFLFFNFIFPYMVFDNL